MQENRSKVTQGILQRSKDCLNSVGNVLCSTSYWTKGLSEPSASYLYILAQSLASSKIVFEL